MPFVKGQSGNPGGRPKGSNPKMFTDMLRVAIQDAHKKGGTKLRAVADKLVDEAINGNVQAIKEIADRLEGKPAQVQVHQGDPDTPVVLQVTKSEMEL